jgi:hypothetical protein
MKKLSLFLFLLASLLGSVVYNVYDNQRFVVVEETVALERLPPVWAPAVTHGGPISGCSIHRRLT